MAKPAPSAVYDPVAKALHWLIALAVIGMLAVGWIMVGLPNGPEKFALFQWHKSIGITVLLLALVRLAWRLKHPAPLLPSTMPGWEKFAAHAGHFLLYALMIGMPLVGWVVVSTSPLNLPTMFYGFFQWPHLPVLSTLENRKEINDLAAWAHGVAAWIFVALIVGHAAAAWKHHLINRDNVLLRMMPKALTGFLNRLRGQK
ncbi:MAG: cytochrome b [Alphaproteobacteria bacterium]|nr:cytochrome b [Alphaproteobacteria bacterium]